MELSEYPVGQLHIGDLRLTDFLVVNHLRTHVAVLAQIELFQLGEIEQISEVVDLPIQIQLLALTIEALRDGHVITKLTLHLLLELRVEQRLRLQVDRRKCDEVLTAFDISLSINRDRLGGIHIRKIQVQAIYHLFGQLYFLLLPIALRPIGEISILDVAIPAIEGQQQMIVQEETARHDTIERQYRLMVLVIRAHIRRSRQRLSSLLVDRAHRHLIVVALRQIADDIRGSTDRQEHRVTFVVDDPLHLHLINDGVVAVLPVQQYPLPARRDRQVGDFAHIAYLTIPGKILVGVEETLTARGHQQQGQQ